MDIVLVHGFRGNHEGLMAVARELAKRLMGMGGLERLRGTRVGVEEGGYASGEIKVEPIGGGYGGVKLKYAGGDIFVLDIPPFGKAGKLSGAILNEVENLDSRTAVYRRLNKYFPEDYADFMADFIRSQGLKRPVLVGHSMGSLVVAATAWRYPELVNKKVVLLAPISRRTNKFFTQLQPLVTKLPNKTLGYITTRFLYVPKRGVVEGLAGKMRERSEVEMRGNDAILYHETNNYQKYREILDLTYRGGGEYASAAAVAAAAKFSTSYEIGDFPLDEGGEGEVKERDGVVSGERQEESVVSGEGWDGTTGGEGWDGMMGGEGKDGTMGGEGKDGTMGGEGKDVLLLAGEKDRLIPKRQTEEAARELGYKAEFIEGAGHLLNYEKPGEVAEAIVRFLAD